MVPGNYFRAIRYKFFPDIGAVFSKREKAEITLRMDQGDFNFDEALVARMKHAWNLNPSAVPYPSKFNEAYVSSDAISMNSKEIMELSYKLPYGIAYENKQIKKYERLLRMVVDEGVELSGNIADVGCGYGGLLETVRDFSPESRLFGMEVAESAINWIQQNRPRINAEFFDLTTPVDESRMLNGVDLNVVFCTEVLEHLVNAKLGIENLLSLSPRGNIVLTVPNGRDDISKQHINFWSPESWQQFILENSQGRPVFISKLQNENMPGGFENICIIFS